MTQTLEQIIARWDANEGKPYKGKLIDLSSYDGDGTEPPTDIGCMCAQGQVLHLMGGWTPRMLEDIEQSEADRATAELLGISLAHSTLLRSVNDSVDGAPSIVLTHPEKVLGDQAHIVLAFWRHMDRMTEEQWDAAWDAAWDAERAAARAARAARAALDAERDAAWDAERAAARAARAARDARDAARDAALAAARDARDAARDAALAAALDAAWDAALAAALAAAWDAAWDAAWACSEIQGAKIMREKNQPFFFLPMFGFADPEAVLAADVQS